MTPNPLYTDEQLNQIESIIRVGVDDIFKRSKLAIQKRLARSDNSYYDMSPLERVPGDLCLLFIENAAAVDHQDTYDEVRQILSQIQKETGVHFEMDNSLFKRFMRFVLSERNPDNQWLDDHPIKRPGEKLSLAFPDVGLNHDVMGLLWRYGMDTTQRNALGGSHATRAPVHSMFRQNIQSAFRQNQIVYAVPSQTICTVKRITVNLTSSVVSSVFNHETDRYVAVPVSFATLAQFCQDLKEPEDGYFVFSSKADAQAYLRTKVVLEQGEITEAPPILTIANVGGSLRFKHEGEDGLLCTRMPRKTGFILGIEVFVPSRGKDPYTLKNKVMIKTPFDALQPKPLGQKALQAVEVVDARWKHIRNRNEAHQAFMDTIPHRPLTINDFRRWLKEFYCEHYLPKRKNGAAKAEDLRQLLCALDQAEALGAEFGTDLSKFLACKPSGINSIAHALQSKRRKKSRDQSWGWTTVCNTFLKPELVTLTRDNRDQFHRDFMKAVQNDVPTLTDFLQWLKEFYCEHYLPTQKHGEKKRDAIEAMLNAIPLPKKDDSGAKLLSIAEFLEQHPGLQTQIQSKRMGISKKESWGWKQIEESFLEPERLAKQPQYGLG